MALAAVAIVGGLAVAEGRSQAQTAEPCADVRRARQGG